MVALYFLGTDGRRRLGGTRKGSHTRLHGNTLQIQVSITHNGKLW